jgi:hypothetical protein
LSFDLWTPAPSTTYTDNRNYQLAKPGVKGKMTMSSVFGTLASIGMAVG